MLDRKILWALAFGFVLAVTGSSDDATQTGGTGGTGGGMGGTGGMTGSVSSCDAICDGPFTFLGLELGT